MKEFAEAFGVLGKDVLAIAKAVFTLVGDILTTMGGGDPGNKGQYPFG